MFYRNSDNTGSTSWLFPVYYSDSSKNQTNIISPFFWYSDSSRENRLHIFPFYNKVKKYDENGEILEKSWYTPALLPLICKSESKNRSSSKALFGTLYNSENVNGNTEGSVLGFMADWSSGEKTSHFRFPALFDFKGLVGYSQHEDKSTANFLLYSHEKNKDVTRRDIFPFIT